MMEERVMKVVVVEEGKPTYDETATVISIANDGGGEYVSVLQDTEADGEQEIGIEPDGWPFLRDAIEKMVKDCREET